MPLVLTRQAPLRLPRRWRAEIVASERGWHLAVTHAGPRGATHPKYYTLDAKGCLELLAGVKRGWRRIAFHRGLRRASPGASLRGIYASSGAVAVGRDLLGDHVAVFGLRLRTRRAVARFRRAVHACVRLGRAFRRELARNRGRLA